MKILKAVIVYGIILLIISLTIFFIQRIIFAKTPDLTAKTITDAPQVSPRYERPTETPATVYVPLETQIPRTTEIPIEPTSLPIVYNNIAEGDILIGNLTFYDICLECCGKLDGYTTSGLRLQNGVEPETPIASCNWLPLGSTVEVNNIIYLIADRGGTRLSKVGNLDIFTPEGHNEALRLGKIKDVEILIVSIAQGG